MTTSFTGSIKKAFIKAFDFKTRSSRAEFWHFYLFTVIVGMIGIQIDQYLFFYFVAPLQPIKFH